MLLEGPLFGTPGMESTHGHTDSTGINVIGRPVIWYNRNVLGEQSTQGYKDSTGINVNGRPVILYTRNELG